MIRSRGGAPGFRFKGGLAENIGAGWLTSASPVSGRVYMAVGPAISNWTVQDFILFSKLTAKRSSDGNFASTRSFRSRVLHST